ncbi:MAG: hypothetical protein KDD62_03470 [Bdellovibrionales bacterium]|nr:hypothetical protein [Bdellovibrionales bacterium]
MNEECYQGGLSSRNERLLQRYYDADRSLFVSLMARYLLGSSKEANLFLKSLEEQSVLLRMWAKEQESSVECWDIIEQRIAQEEHAQIFLGERKVVPVRRLSVSPFAWSLSGAVVSAVFVFGIMSSFAPTGVGFDPQAALNNEMRPVVAQANPELASIPIVARGAEPDLPVRLVSTAPQPSEVEVDWLLSDGSVRMIQGSRGEVPIIWIKRKRSIPGSPSESAPRRIPQAVVVNNGR